MPSPRFLPPCLLPKLSQLFSPPAAGERMLLGRFATLPPSADRPGPFARCQDKRALEILNGRPAFLSTTSAYSFLSAEREDLRLDRDSPLCRVFCFAHMHLRQDSGECQTSCMGGTLLLLLHCCPPFSPASEAEKWKLPLPPITKKSEGRDFWPPQLSTP